MVKVISAHKDPRGGSPPMTEEDVKNFLTNNNGRLLIHMGTIDEKGEPNVFPTGYYFDRDSDKIYITTPKKSKKISNLRLKSIGRAGNTGVDTKLIFNMGSQCDGIKTDTFRTESYNVTTVLSTGKTYAR